MAGSSTATSGTPFEAICWASSPSTSFIAPASTKTALNRNRPTAGAKCTAWPITFLDAPTTDDRSGVPCAITRLPLDLSGEEKDKTPTDPGFRHIPCGRCWYRPDPWERTMRTESDSLGTVEVPDEALWAAQTGRAMTFFAIAQDRMPTEVIRALATIKKAAALTNAELGVLDE